MKILITGVSGLLGINLALELTQAHQVFGVVNDHRLELTALPAGKGFEITQADLTKAGVAKSVIDKIQPDWIIHCAALANLEVCESNPSLAQRLNAEVPGELAALAARSGARLLHISTDAVFDGKKGDYDETDRPNPLSVYAQSKLDGERRVLEANPEAAVARVNLHGWSISGKRSLAEFFFYNLQAGKSVLGFTDVYFCPVLANDLAPIFIAMLEKGLQGLYHAVSCESLTKYDFGLCIARKFGLDENLIRPSSVEEAGLKAARSPRLTLKTEKISQALGFDMPATAPGIESLYQLHQQAYPQLLQELLQELLR
jgi:dTDP-4-dehydrorhamnose reductase